MALSNEQIHSVSPLRLDPKARRVFVGLFALHLLANGVGAASSFVYLSVVANLYVNGDSAPDWSRFGLFMGGTGLCALLLIAWVVWPLMGWLRAQPLDGPAAAAPDNLRRRALGLPLMMTLISAAAWSLAGLFFISPRDDVYEIGERFLTITIGAGLPSVVLHYLLIDLVWRRLIPRFFPDGDVPRYATARLTLRRRLLLLAPLVTYLPLVLITLITFNRATLLAETGNRAYLSNLLASQIYVASITILLILLSGYSVARSVILPLRKLQHGFEQVGSGDLSARLPVVTNDELGVVAAGFNQMVGELAIGREAERARARIAHELELARRTQQSLLPRELPRVRYLEVATSSEPASQVGGDFYGHYLLPDGDLAITLGDVSGKGMAAALLMAATTGLIGAHVRVMGRPAELLAEVNDALRFHTAQSGLNTALCVMHFAPDGDGVLATATNAGGIWPLVRRADGTMEWLEVCGPPLGTSISTPPYPTTHRHLDGGDLVILTSDGVVEAKDATGEIFGFERLAAAVAGLNRRRPAQALHDDLLAALRAFTGDTPLHDDLTLIVLKVTPPLGPG